MSDRLPTFHCSQIQTAEDSRADCRSTQISVVEAGSCQIGSLEAGSAQIGIAKCGRPEIGPVEAGVAEIGKAQIDIAEVGSVEIGFAEFSLEALTLGVLPGIPDHGSLFEDIKMLLVCHLFSPSLSHTLNQRDSSEKNVLRLLETISERRVALPIEHAFDSKANSLSWSHKDSKLLRSSQTCGQQITRKR